MQLSMTQVSLSRPRPLHGALVGFGFIAERGHLPAYGAILPGGAELSIVAVADVCPERRAHARAALPGARVYDDHASLLAAERGRLDFIDITTPPCDHAKIAHAALDQGLHVLCEKPLTTSAEGARALCDHARRAERVLYPCHTYKHAPVVQAVRRVIDAGVIGKVNLVTLQTFRNTHARGVPEWHADWRREQRFSGGGIAMDHGSHTFYLAFEWLGGYPHAITAKMSTQGPYDTEDNFSCALAFPNGMASAHLSWTAGVRKVIYTVHGERGAIRVEDDAVEVTSLRRSPDGAVAWERVEDQVSSNWMDAGHAPWFASLLHDFAAAVEARAYVGREAEDAVRCVELITTAYSSAREGSREIRLGRVGQR
jgi:predicted dehydrogenase